MPSTVAPTEVSPTALLGVEYVSLGDSFASGEGVPPFFSATAVPGTNSCHRSTRAYPELVAGKPGIPPVRTRAACSGAGLAHLFSRGQWNEPSQATRLRVSTGLVTLTIGGNDVGFSSVAVSCVLTTSCQATLASRVQRLTDSVGALLPAFYRAVANRAPNARILVVGYPRLFPQSPYRDCPQIVGSFDTGEQRWFNAATARLDAAIRSAVASLGTPRARYVDVYDAFAGRELCGGGGAVNPAMFPNYMYSLHPTASGQSLIANRVLRAAWAA